MTHRKCYSKGPIIVSTVQCLRNSHNPDCPPKELQSDNGSEFNNMNLQRLVEDTIKEYQLSPAYTPRVNGKAESMVNSSKKLFDKNIGSLPDNTLWSRLTKIIQFQLNTRPTPISPFTPFSLVYGRHPQGIFGEDFTQRMRSAFDLKEWSFNWDDVNDAHIKMVEHKKAEWDKVLEKYNKAGMIQPSQDWRQGHAKKKRNQNYLHAKMGRPIPNYMHLES